MVRRLRSPTLESRTARLKLKVRRKPYFVSVAPGISLGYRKNRGPGSWLVRCADGKGGAWTEGFGIADDVEDADGVHVLDFWTAQTRAREQVRGKGADKPVTLAQALDDYQRDLALRGGLVAHVQRVRRLLTPVLLKRPVGLLTARELRHWRDGQLSSGLSPATVTRTCKALKACLNHAAASDETIGNGKAWTKGLEAIPDSQRARTDAVLSDDEVRAVVAACYDASDRLGVLTEFMAVTGCRPIQAARLRVADLKADHVMLPRSSKGRGRKRIDRRSMPLKPDLIAKLRAAVSDRPGDAPLLRRPDGQAWQPWRSDLVRLFGQALAAAGLPKAVPYALRHSSIVRNLTKGLSPQLVADTHDTSVAMLAKHYAAYIADHSTELIRRVQLDLAPAPTDKVAPLPAR
jgi:integrase